MGLPRSQEGNDGKAGTKPAGTVAFPSGTAMAARLAAAGRQACSPREGSLLMSAATPMADEAHGAISTNSLCENREELGRGQPQRGESRRAGREGGALGGEIMANFYKVPASTVAAKPSSSLVPLISPPKRHRKSGATRKQAPSRSRLPLGHHHGLKHCQLEKSCHRAPLCCPENGTARLRMEQPDRGCRGRTGRPLTGGYSEHTGTELVFASC